MAIWQIVMVVVRTACRVVSTWGRLQVLVNIRRMDGGFAICMEMFGSGVKIGTGDMRVMQPIRRVRQQEMFVCVVVAVGLRVRDVVVPRIVDRMRQMIVTTVLVFVLFVQ